MTTTIAACYRPSPSCAAKCGDDAGRTVSLPPARRAASLPLVAVVPCSSGRGVGKGKRVRLHQEATGSPGHNDSAVEIALAAGATARNRLRGCVLGCMDAAFTVSSAESTHIPTDMALLRHRASCRPACQPAASFPPIRPRGWPNICFNLPSPSIMQAGPPPGKVSLGNAATNQKLHFSNRCPLSIVPPAAVFLMAGWV